MGGSQGPKRYLLSSRKAGKKSSKGLNLALWLYNLPLNRDTQLSPVQGGISQGLEKSYVAHYSWQCLYWEVLDTPELE